MDEISTFVDESAEPFSDGIDMENELTNPRRATALVDRERWDALLGALIEAEVLTAAEVAAMSERLAAKLEAHARGAMGRLTNAPELLDAARRSRDVARMCRVVRCG